MNKKDLKKKLQLALIKNIDETLKKNNVDAAKQIGKTITNASKKVVKKFYKKITELSGESVVKPNTKRASGKKTLKKGTSPIIITSTEVAKKRG